MNAIMEDLDEIDRRLDALIAERNELRDKLDLERGASYAAINERDDAIAERNALQNERREIVGELRKIRATMPGGWQCTINMTALLKRIDPQTTKDT